MKIVCSALATFEFLFSSENDGDNNELVTDTHPLKNSKQTEIQVGKCSSSSGRGLFAQVSKFWIAVKIYIFKFHRSSV